MTNLRSISKKKKTIAQVSSLTNNNNKEQLHGKFQIYTKVSCFLWKNHKKKQSARVHIKTKNERFFFSLFKIFKEPVDKNCDSDLFNFISKLNHFAQQLQEHNSTPKQIEN